LVLTAVNIEMRLCAFVLAVVATGALAKAPRTLVLVDTLATRETHSIFLKELSERGHDVSVKSADEPSLLLSKYGESLFENLVLFCPGVEEFGGSLSVEAIVEFIDAGGNMVLAGSSEATDLIRELATEVGVEMDEERSAVIDHLHHDTKLDEGQHTVISAPVAGLLAAPLVVGQPPAAPLLYRGTGLTTDADNPLLLPLLKAASTAYSHDPNTKITEFPHAVGTSVVLLAGLQARNNARVLVSGSLEFFSDAFLSAAVNTPQGGSYQQSGNAPVVQSVTQWALKEAGVLRVTGVSHNKVGEDFVPHEYTVKEELEYHIHVEELVSGAWVPFQAKDMQLEFVRIDPFVITALAAAASDGHFQASFTVPDVYGVYQFKVEYNRVGYTRLHSTTQIPVRPFLHTQYERFIVCAYPYYASSFSMMAGLFLFSLVFLHHRPQPATRPKAE